MRVTSNSVHINSREKSSGRVAMLKGVINENLNEGELLEALKEPALPPAENAFYDARVRMDVTSAVSIAGIPQGSTLRKKLLTKAVPTQIVRPILRKKQGS